MSETHGGPNKNKSFRWHYDARSQQLVIINENNRKLVYNLLETGRILQMLYADFHTEYFPLANNVEHLFNGTEKNGLGMIILKQKPGDIAHAQGASYLGVILEECGFLEWNGKHSGIKWRLKETNLALAFIASRFTR